MLAVDQTLTPRIEVVSAEPPLIIMHNFLSPGDCSAILEATKEQDMKRSTMGATQEESQDRTSSTAWLAESQCEGPFGGWQKRRAAYAQLPPSHMENLQVVRYLPGQEFTLHTDHLDSFNDLECRGRLATCLIYLDVPRRVEKQAFPSLGWRWSQQRVRHVFFWNTQERPGMDGRMRKCFSMSIRSCDMQGCQYWREKSGFAIDGFILLITEQVYVDHNQVNASV